MSRAAYIFRTILPASLDYIQELAAVGNSISTISSAHWVNGRAWYDHFTNMLASLPTAPTFVCPEDPEKDNGTTCREIFASTRVHTSGADIVACAISSIKDLNYFHQIW
ncbi:hypothetical protein TRVL_03237 [Trypanosoma vivax]|nr:hypothetical protein TRVL_03237 [Trypanosoma vivax]